MPYFSPDTIGGGPYLAPDEPPAASVMLVGADLACAYSIDAAPVTFVGADLVCTFDIDASPVTLVGADLACSYAIEAGAGSIVLVGADLTAFYAILDNQTMSFTPSPTRTITINPDAAKPFTGGAFWNTQDAKKPKGVKDPDSSIDIPFDWTPWLTDAADIGALFTFIVEGVIDAGSSVRGDSKGATIFVSGGLIGTPATITCRMTSASVPPRIVDRTVYLTIEAQ